MNPHLLATLAIAAAYLVGSIPFGYLIFYWARGIDVRTVGSGNIGATNVGRQLGFRFFVIVFLLDMAKGFLPARGFPRAVNSLTSHQVANLPVLVALASILGHNFPVFLRFKGGKGVATSFGALLALDLTASLAAVAGFFVSLVVTSYISLSSITGGVFFFVSYFAQIKSPWDREHIGMSLFTIALLVLLIVRHYKNLRRLWQGTEPKVSFRKKKPPPPSGRISRTLILVLAASGLGLIRFGVHASRRSEADLGPFRLTEVARVGTGHQRAERIAFADEGRLLVVTCPRYNRVVLYRVGDARTVELSNDVELEGCPVAVTVSHDRLYVLQRPPGDSRHVVPGWWETLDFQGRRLGSRQTVGFYPDDMALTPDGRHALVLTSGRAEGGKHRPAPALDVYELGTVGGASRVVGRLTFDQPSDDPARITLSESGRCAVVSLPGSNQGAAVDLFDVGRPRLAGRSPLADLEAPYPSKYEGDAILMPVSSRSEALWFTFPGPTAEKYLACTLPHRSGLKIIHAETGRSLGELFLRGPMNLGKTRPTGLAFSAELNLLAVSNRSGGVHLIALQPRSETPEARDRLATAGARPRRD